MVRCSEGVAELQRCIKREISLTALWTSPARGAHFALISNARGIRAHLESLSADSQYTVQSCVCISLLARFSLFSPSTSSLNSLTLLRSVLLLLCESSALRDWDQRPSRAYIVAIMRCSSSIRDETLSKIIQAGCVIGRMYHRCSSLLGSLYNARHN